MDLEINSSRAPEPVGMYPHARKVGNLLYLSGVGPRERGTKKIPGVELAADGSIQSYDIETQCRSVFANVRAILEDAGASWEDLVDVTVYLTDMKKDFPTYNKLWAEHFPRNRPCRTTLEVGALPTPIAIELKCVAQLPEKKPAAAAGAFAALDFKKWIEENRHLLKPPVGNKVIWPQRDYIVMAVGGPNERTDFHVNEGEEFFYQIEGDMVLKVIDGDGKISDVPIREGSIFLLPPKTPHSPQRGAGTVGLVIESRRKPGQMDGLQWYCESCHQKLYEEWFHLTDIEKQFSGVFERYYASPHTRCKHCDHVNGRKWSHAKN